MKQLKVIRKGNKSRTLNAEILKSFLLFGLSFMLILSLFQIGLLNFTYRLIRINETKRTASQISEMLQEDPSGFKRVSELTYGHDMSVAILRNNAIIRIDSSSGAMNDFTRRLSLNDIQFLSRQLKNRDDIALFMSDTGAREATVSELLESQKAYYHNDVHTLLYALRCQDDEGTMMVMIASSIVPVNSTVRTLKVQLLIIAVIGAVIGLILSVFLSRRLAKPIEELSEDARVLATGNYDVSFDSEGYSEIEELSDSLSHMASELKKADQMSRDLIANVSHDLRTPLTMISGYGELIRDFPQENTPENVQVIIDEANRLSSMVNNLLDISKLQSGNQQLNVSDINALELVEGVIGNYRKLVENLGVSVELNSLAGDVYFKGDKERLVQVFHNLLNNAVNHLGDDMKVIVNYSLVNGKVRYEVIDHGEGIAPEDLDKIWDRYYKVDRQHVRAQTGSGLGLSIVKTILDMHHAQYGVTSELNKGSCFYFELPVLEKGEIINLDE